MIGFILLQTFAVGVAGGLAFTGLTTRGRHSNCSRLLRTPKMVG